MIFVRLKFLGQPANLDVLTFTLGIDTPLVRVYTAIFVTGIPIAGQIQIGANLTATLTNVKNYIDSTYGSPEVSARIAGNDIIIEPLANNFTLNAFTNIPSVLTISEETTPKEIIRVRSPYFIEINEASQTSSKVELFIWNKGETEPLTPTYTLSKNAPSTTQRANTYNISSYIKENIDIIAPTATNIVAEESVNMWAYCRVKRYSTVSGVETLLDNVIYIGLNGYTSYSNGYNFSFPNNNLVLVNGKITRYYFLKTGFSDSSYFNYFMQQTLPNDTIEVRYYNKSNTLIATTSLVSDNDYLYRIPYTRNNAGLVDGGYVTIYNVTDAFEIETIFSEPLCEPKYTPVVCAYINSNGGWQYLTFFKAKTESFESKSKDYNLLPNAVDYNELRGQSKAFNFVATKSIKINTGWVDENYSLIIQDLFNSETILLGNSPVKLKTTSFELKTSLKDKMINYEIDFEYNFNQINNVI